MGLLLFEREPVSQDKSRPFRADAKLMILKMFFHEAFSQTASYRLVKYDSRRNSEFCLRNSELRRWSITRL